MERRAEQEEGPVRRALGCDLRSLAALRIALGTLVLVDVVTRVPDLVVHYTDRGALPRGAAAEELAAGLRGSLHMISGGAVSQALLFLLAALAGLLLVLGLRTRWATLACWALVHSVQARASLLLQGGDTALRVLLFFGLFVPLGARWSLDRRLAGVEPGEEGTDHVASPGTAALLLQGALLYLCAGLEKTGPTWTESHTAVRRALMLPTFARPLGTWLVAHAPGVLDALTPAVLLLERWGAPALLLPPLRPLLLPAFLALQVGILLTMDVAFFPFAGIAALLPFVPAGVWDGLERRVPGLRETVPGAPPAPPPSLRALGRVLRVGPVRVRLGLGSGLLAAGAIAYVLAGTLSRVGPAALEPPSAWRRLMQPLWLEQRWELFAPDPLRFDAWFRLEARYADGRRVDLMTGRPVEDRRTPRGSARLRGFRWRKYLYRLRRSSREPLRVHLGKALCREENRGAPRARALERLDLVMVRTDLGDDLRWEAPRRVRLWRHFCFAEDLDAYVEEARPERVYR